MDRVGFARLADSVGDYAGAVSPSGIYLIIDREFEVYDQDQLPMRVTTISVLVADVPTSSRNDTITIGEKAWTVWRILEDDGHVRRLEVG